jgi:hypothetical protein
MTTHAPPSIRAVTPLMVSFILGRPVPIAAAAKDLVSKGDPFSSAKVHAQYSALVRFRLRSSPLLHSAASDGRDQGTKVRSKLVELGWLRMRLDWQHVLLGSDS